MKSQSIFGIVLIIVGVLIFFYQGFSFTQQSQVAKVGPVEINKTERKTVPISPIIGIVCVAGGVFLVWQGARKAS